MSEPAASAERRHVDRSWRRRVFCIQAVVCLGLALVALRLVQLQLVQAEALAARAQRQQTSEEVLRARPGDLVDRRGQLLATTLTVPSLAIDPSRVDDPAALAKQLAECLSLSESALRDRIEANRKRQFLWVKRRLDDGEVAAVRELHLPRDVAFLETEFQRRYPQGELAAHVVGLRGVDGEARGGAEEAFDKLLTGTDGRRRFVRDARGYVLDVLEEVTQPPVDGARVELTLDLRIQLHLERALDAVMREHAALSACGVVLDPRTGEVLALAGRPTFDPSRPEVASEDAWLNRAIGAVYEPGSTFKPLIVAWGLHRGLLQRDEWFRCERGAYRMGTRLLHDHHPYGDLDVTGILVKSSNIGMAKIGERMGNEELFAAVNAFRFGRRTGIELPGEVAGIVRPRELWDAYSTGSIPMGQEIAATPLQLLAAHAALANGGEWIAPHVLLRASGANSSGPALVTAPVVEQEIADWLVREPLRLVVEAGTGTKAKLPDVDVFGKTGTAQKMNSDGSYSSTRHYSSFVCGAPAAAPRVMVLIGVDEPRGDDQYGGSVAAPAAARVLRESIRLHAPRVTTSD